MKFQQSLRLFLYGFIPGCIILFFIVNKTGCTSPNELKMLEIQHQYLQLGAKAKCKIACLSLSEKAFKLNIKNFKVSYDLSEVHKKPYGLFYLKTLDTKKMNYEFVVEDRDTITFVNDISLLGTVTNCQCDTVK